MGYGDVGLFWKDIVFIFMIKKCINLIDMIMIEFGYCCTNLIEINFELGIYHIISVNMFLYKFDIN